MRLRKYKKRLRIYFSRSKVIITACAVIALFLGINLIKETISKHRIDNEIDSYNQEIIRLARENKEIDNLISSWKTSGQLEKEARIKLGLQKAGESVVLILRESDERGGGYIIDPNSRIIGGLVVSGSIDNRPNYQKWWSYFFN